MGWTVFYGSLVALVGGLAWLSKDHVTQKLSLILMAAWSFSNIAYAALGADSVPVCDPTIEIGCAALTALLGYSNRSLPALAVFSVYGVMLLVHGGFIIPALTSDRAYIPVVNALFLLQLAVVGGNGAWVAIRNRVHLDCQRASHLLAHR